MNVRNFLCCFAIIPFCTMAFAQKVNIKKGDKFSLVMNSDMTMNMETMGQEIDTKFKTGNTSDLEVKDKTDTGYVFGNTLKHITINTTAAGQSINFDSDKKEDMDGEIGQTLKDKIGKESDIDVNSSGIITSMGGIDDSTSSINSMIGDMVEGMPFMVISPLQGKKLKAGDTWLDSTVSPDLKYVSTYTLKQINGNEMTIAYASTISRKGTLEQNGMQIQLDISGTMNGENIYETLSGVLKTATTSGDIKGTMGVMGQSIPVSIKATTGMAVTRE